VATLLRFLLLRGRWRLGLALLAFNAWRRYRARQRADAGTDRAKQNQASERA